jgi:AraC-like DNA-binding protein
VNPVGKALWYIESHFGNEITLDEVANIAGVSRYHMTRAFADVTGHSLIRYVRGRRLTEAARALAGGATNILSVALDAGYGSHEAFTRAFREQFDLTPEAVREQGDLQYQAPGAHENGRDGQNISSTRAVRKRQSPPPRWNRPTIHVRDERWHPFAMATIHAAPWKCSRADRPSRVRCPMERR